MTLTGAELSRLIGRTGLYGVKGAISFRVTVTDWRNRYGRIDVLLVPEAGEGETWTEITNVRLDA